MNFNRLIIVSFTVLLFLSSCLNGKIKGLWVLQRERIEREGQVEHESEANWIRFDDDGYQESGSGWQKHSYGTWSIKKKKITIQNTNGFEDTNVPRKVKIKKETMTWVRPVDGKNVTTTLKKIELIPVAKRDKLLGVWKLETVLENGVDKSLEYNPKGTRYVQIRWDNFFITDNGPQGRTSGVYHVDAHINEIEVYYNKSTVTRQSFVFEQEGDRLVLTSVAGDKEVIMGFKKINYLPKH